MKRSHVSFILVVCAAALGLWASRGGNDPVTLRAPSLRATAAITEMASPASHPGATDMSPAHLRTPTQPPSVGALARGMSSPDPLAFVTEQQALSGPGSFANSDQVTFQCREASRVARSSLPDIAAQRANKLGKDPAAFQARFIEAQQMVQSRCSSFRLEVPADRAREDDVYARSYNKARADLFKINAKTSEALVELAKQGQLASAAVVLAGLPRFQGEDFRAPEDAEIFRRAVLLASFNATSLEADRSNDLRTFTACLQTGICDGSFESYALSKWPEGSPQREKALALSKRMEAAFRSNSVSAWTSKP